MAYQGRVDNQGVRIHYIDSRGDDTDSSLVPLVLVPGMFGKAEDYLNEMMALAPRRCVAISLRGRGQSDTPASGYTFEAHVSDLRAVIEHLDLEDFCLMGVSVGAAYALGYATRHAARLNGLIIADYPAQYPRLPPEWIEHTLITLPDDDDLSFHLLEALQSESEAIELWDRLENVGCPVLVMRGDQADSRLSPADAQRYLHAFPAAMTVVFTGSGHDLRLPSYERFIGAIRLFLAQLDSSAHG
jgi:pimeloyl-ACP methyl ester carboxylesterase